MVAARRAGNIVVLEDLAPLYVVRFEGIASDAQFAAYLAHVLRITQRGEVHAMVYDASAAGWVPPSQRQLQVEWMREHDKLNRDTTAGLAFVLPSPLVRGVLTAMLWLAPMPCPHLVARTLDQGLVWCRERLTERGMLLPHEPTPQRKV